MQNTADFNHSVRSPPFILDSNMPGQFDSDVDFEFLNNNLGLQESPGLFYGDVETGSSPYLSNTWSPNLQNSKAAMPEPSPVLEAGPSARSPTSLVGSYQDSASDSSGSKRKSSSDSSRSGITTGDVMMGDTDTRDWNVGENCESKAASFGAFDGSLLDIDSMNSGFGFNDQSMENDFDFDSAANSPNPFRIGPVDMESPEMPIIKTGTPKGKSSPMPKDRFVRDHRKANSQNSVTQSMTGLTTGPVTEGSPLSAMVTSQESSPSDFFNVSPPPGPSLDFVNGTLLNNTPSNPTWSGNFDGLSSTMAIASHSMGHSMGLSMTGLSSQSFPDLISNGVTRLTIHPIPLKSRVETQIPIKLTLHPLPPGVIKLHLPTHTISKPKLLAKPRHEMAYDTLELYTNLVCTSAMQNLEHRQRAFERAANPETASDPILSENAGDDDPNKPLNGGDVKICAGCITRERKRAARKKVKKVEEEESWHQDESKRVIVFNTHEIKEWQTPTSQVSSEAAGEEPSVPQGALQVDAPMRIACYCRHQSEKIGFQVIFTIKDHQGRLIAQAMTASIMITDDHKTHGLIASQNSNGCELATNVSDTGMMNGFGTFDFSTGSVGNMAAFPRSTSSSNLSGLPGAFNMSGPPSVNFNTSAIPSHTTSAAVTPRNVSRQTSPSASSAPISKKRKASGSGKVPSGLAMTRIETDQFGQMAMQNVPNIPGSAVPSPYTPSMSNFPIPSELQHGHPSGVMPNMPHHFHTGPPTPNSNDNSFFSNSNRTQSMESLRMHQMYSAPASAHQSRASSPSQSNMNNLHAYQHQAQLAQAVSSSLYGLPLNINQQRPTIHKLIPNEGPIAGGVEVTCLGSGFCQGLEVMFGDVKATTTTFWGETSLVCLLPPAAAAGSVFVTFKHQYQQSQMGPYPSPPIPKHHPVFTYVDDLEQQLIKSALAVLGHKMNGTLEDVRDIARRIMGDGSPPGPQQNGSSPPGAYGNQAGFHAAKFGVDVEATLLKCLDLIDLDDSPRMPRLNMRRKSGQTMLHLACSLGLQRFVAALLARGANPELRDKGGFTPMHFAALHGHSQIVRRLMLTGADPSIRSFQGFTASDMATSKEVIRAARRIEYHSRTHSGSSLRSRANSAKSLRSVWQPLSSKTATNQRSYSDTSSDNYESEDMSEDKDASDGEVFWMRSRRTSLRQPADEAAADENDHTIEMPAIGSPALVGSPTAAMMAFRDQLSAQIHHLQQTVQLNLPNLPQMPRFDMMPALPDYQAYLPTTPMVRRISNFVVNNRADNAKEQDYRWWDLFAGTIPAAPPAYEDIYPTEDLDIKLASVEHAALDAVVDDKCVRVFDKAQSSASALKKTTTLEKVRIGQHTITREQQDQLRLAHAERVKRLRSDRNLFFIWIPLLVIVILAMLYNRVPQVWAGTSRLLERLTYRWIQDAPTAAV